VSADQRSRIATLLFAVAIVEVAIAIGAGVASGLGWERLFDLFVVTNALIGLSLAVAGWLIAYHRPDNAVGWWLLLGGCFYPSTAAVIAVLAWTGEPTMPWRMLATVANGGWTWALSMFIPTALLTFPDGRLPSRRWRWVWVVVAASAVLWAVSGVFDPLGGLTAEVSVPGYPAWSGFEQIVVVNAIAAVGLLITYVAALAALVVRYRRGSERVRGQVLWLLLALVVIVTCSTVEAVLDLQSLILGVLPLLLIPAAIAVAVLRYQLLDIRLVVSRSVLYLLLTAGVVIAYLVLVTLLDATLRQWLPLDVPIVATLLIALAFNPVRVWVQRLLQRAFYGARRDPVRAMAAVGARLGEVGTSPQETADLAGVLEALCRVMRLPAAALMVGDVQVAEHGSLPPVRHAIALGSGEQQVGELVVGLRSGEHRLNPADEQVLTLLAAPLTVAVQAERLAEELRASRERVISGREEERRRIRRDLHDGLGPVLTGLVLNAEAARRLLDTDRDRSAALLSDLRDQTIGAIEEIRRLVYDLRPPALDGMGLVGAVREYAAVLGRRRDGTPVSVSVEASADLGELPAAVEVAAYRIATEALTNVVKHSTASAAQVRLVLEPTALRVDVHDDGVNAPESWQPGVGLTSIRERTAELGGECEIRQDRTGGRIVVRLPLAVARSASAEATTQVGS
jgi:two-component system, NarL family, sensor kinase